MTLVRETPFRQPNNPPSLRPVGMQAFPSTLHHLTLGLECKQESFREESPKVGKFPQNQKFWRMQHQIQFSIFGPLVVVPNIPSGLCKEPCIQRPRSLRSRRHCRAGSVYEPPPSGVADVPQEESGIFDHETWVTRKIRTQMNGEKQRIETSQALLFHFPPSPVI